MPGETILTDGDDGAHVRLPIGGLLRVRLAETPATGYRWELDHEAEKIELVAATYEPPGSTALGAGGVREFVFCPRRPGSASLGLALRRPWEGSHAAERRFSLTVSVT